MLEEELERMAPDLGVIEEWKRKDASCVQRLADLETATAARNEVPCLTLCPARSASHETAYTMAVSALGERHFERFPAIDTPPGTSGDLCG